MLINNITYITVYNRDTGTKYTSKCNICGYDTEHFFICQGVFVNFQKKDYILSRLTISNFYINFNIKKPALYHS